MIKPAVGRLSFDDVSSHFAPMPMNTGIDGTTIGLERGQHRHKSGTMFSCHMKFLS